MPPHALARPARADDIRPQTRARMTHTWSPRPNALEVIAVVEAAAPDIVDVWGADSFPASDPPANW